MQSDLVTLRPGTLADALTLSALATQVFLDTYATEGIRPDLAREVFATCSADVFATRFGDPMRAVVVAERGDHLLGFAEVVHDVSAPAEGVPRGDELVRLYVQPAAQRGGLGSRLLREAELLSRARAVPVLWLAAWAGNARALKFYAAQRYFDVGSVPYVIKDRSYENRVLVKRFVDEYRR